MTTHFPIYKSLGEPFCINLNLLQFIASNSCQRTIFFLTVLRELAFRILKAVSWGKGQGGLTISGWAIDSSFWLLPFAPTPPLLHFTALGFFRWEGISPAVILVKSAQACRQCRHADNACSKIVGKYGKLGKVIWKIIGQMSTNIKRSQFLTFMFSLYSTCSPFSMFDANILYRWLSLITPLSVLPNVPFSIWFFVQCLMWTFPVWLDDAQPLQVAKWTWITFHHFP